MKFFSTLVITLFISLLAVSCTSSSLSSLEPKDTGYKGISLHDSFEKVSESIPHLKPAPEHISKKIGEGYKEYFTLKEPSFVIERLKFNPSVFCVFNAENKLVSLKVFYLCEAPKKNFALEEVVRRLNNNQIKELAYLYEQEGMRINTSGNITKFLTLDLESTTHPVLKYQAKLGSVKDYE